MSLRPARARGGAGWNFVLLVALLAFAWQSLVTQTHAHLFAALPAVQASQSGHAAQASAQKPSSPDIPANCPICREIAHAGAYLPSAPATLAARDLATYWPTATPAHPLALQPRLQGWRSRAPPTDLHA